MWLLKPQILEGIIFKLNIEIILSFLSIIKSSTSYTKLKLGIEKHS